MATTQTRPEFIDTYWIIPEYSSAPYGKVSFTRQDRRTFIAMFKDSRLIWAGHQRVQDFTENVKRTESPKLPVEGTESRSQFNQSPGLLVRKMPHEGIEEISIPQGMVNISTFNPSHNEHRYSSGGWLMSNFVAIQNTAMPVVEYQGKRVVTFAMIDKVHGRPKGTACAAFNRNRRRFVEGRDFFNVTSYVKRMRSLEGVFPARSSKGILITEFGYLILIKSFNDDLSWDVQNQMVESYFRRNTLGELRHVEIPSLEELSQMPAEKAQHIVAKAEKEFSFGHGKPGSAAMTLRRKELKQIRPAIRTFIDLHQISICDLGDFVKVKNNT